MDKMEKERADEQQMIEILLDLPMSRRDAKWMCHILSSDFPMCMSSLSGSGELLDKFTRMAFDTARMECNDGEFAKLKADAIMKCKAKLLMDCLPNIEELSMEDISRKIALVDEYVALILGCGNSPVDKIKVRLVYELLKAQEFSGHVGFCPNLLYYLNVIMHNAKYCGDAKHAPIYPALYMEKSNKKTHKLRTKGKIPKQCLEQVGHHRHPLPCQGFSEAISKLRSREKNLKNLTESMCRINHFIQNQYSRQLQDEAMELYKTAKMLRVIANNANESVIRCKTIDSIFFYRHSEPMYPVLDCGLMSTGDADVVIRQMSICMANFLRVLSLDDDGNGVESLREETCFDKERQNGDVPSVRSKHNEVNPLEFVSPSSYNFWREYDCLYNYEVGNDYFLYEDAASDGEAEDSPWIVSQCKPWPLRLMNTISLYGNKNVYDYLKNVGTLLANAMQKLDFPCGIVEGKILCFDVFIVLLNHDTDDSEVNRLIIKSLIGSAFESFAHNDNDLQVAGNNTPGPHFKLPPVLLVPFEDESSYACLRIKFMYLENLRMGRENMRNNNIYLMPVFASKLGRKKLLKILERSVGGSSTEEPKRSFRIIPVCTNNDILKKHNDDKREYHKLFQNYEEYLFISETELKNKEKTKEIVKRFLNYCKKIGNGGRTFMDLNLNVECHTIPSSPLDIILEDAQAFYMQLEDNGSEGNKICFLPRIIHNAFFESILLGFAFKEESPEWLINMLHFDCKDNSAQEDLPLHITRDLALLNYKVNHVLWTQSEFQNELTKIRRGIRDREKRIPQGLSREGKGNFMKAQLKDFLNKFFDKSWKMLITPNP